MNKEALIESVQAKLGEDCAKAYAKKVVESVLESIQAGLKQDEEVSLPGFGSFTVRHREARKGINPRTKEQIDIAASKTVGFKPGKPLKDSL